VKKESWGGADEHLWDKLGGREWLSVIFDISPNDFHSYSCEKSGGRFYKGVFSYHNVNINANQTVIISIIENCGNIYLVTGASPLLITEYDYYSLPGSNGYKSIDDIPSAEIVKQLSEATGYHLF
jgi:hypothetical protein